MLAIGNGGTVTAGGLLTVAEQAGSTGLLAIGGLLAPAAPGNLNTATVQFGAGDGALAFNHTDTSGNYAFAPVINGQGTLLQIAGWTNLTADSSGFTGQTHVNGGRLAVNGSSPIPRWTSTTAACWAATELSVISWPMRAASSPPATPSAR